MSSSLRTLWLARIALVAAGGMVILPKNSFALWHETPVQLDRLKSDRKSISVFPPVSTGVKSETTQAFGLTRFGTIDFSQGVKQYIRESLVNPAVAIRETLTSTPRLIGSKPEVSDSLDLQLTVSGIPICDSHIKAHMLWNGNSIILGTVPQLGPFLPTDTNDWPRLDLAIDNISEHLAELGGQPQAQRVIKSERCYGQRGNDLVPAWNITTIADGLGYRAIADGYEVLSFENQFFDVTGKIKAYESNPKSGTIKTYEIDLIGDGFLTSDFFTTKTNGVERAKNSTHQFFYETTDDRFAETSAFAHATLTLEYFRDLGYGWHGPKPLTINLHGLVNRNQNNALYQPASATASGLPEISIADGDGAMLTNLPVDADVIGHEFGHHIIYQTITSVSGESLILHEGLADYFTFAHTKDDCLGESICPAGSLACWTKGQCLRTANNDINFSSLEYTKLEPHLQGQLVSGFLWDLHSKQSIPFDDVTKLLYRAIGYFARNSGFRDLVLALMLADDSETSGTYCQQIYNTAIDRGFGSLIGDLSCDENASLWGQPSGVSTSKALPAPKSRSKYGSSGLCGSIAGAPASNQALVLWLMLMPLFATFFLHRHRTR